MKDIIAVAIITAIPSTLAAMTSWLSNLKLGTVKEKLGTVKQELGTVKEQLNGRLTELLELTRRASHAEGINDEVTRKKREKEERLAATPSVDPAPSTPNQEPTP